MHLLPILAALDMDPTVRGLAIVIAAVIILPGSVFLLLATNVGARLGFLLALTGFFAWMSLQGLVWTVYAQGNRGRLPHWETQEIITGDLAQSTVEAVEDFPGGWQKLEAGDRVLGDAQAAADGVLAEPDPTEAGGHAGGSADEHEAPHFEPPFQTIEDYVHVAGYRKGGETWALSFRHRPHYAVIQVRPAVEVETPPGATPVAPRPDPSKPLTTVVMIRDLGNVRFPPFLLGVSSFVIFCVLLSVLHRRDKEIMAARAQATA